MVFFKKDNLKKKKFFLHNLFLVEYFYASIVHKTKPLQISHREADQTIEAKRPLEACL